MVLDDSPFGANLVTDAIRVVVAAVLCLMCLLVVRLAYVRWMDVRCGKSDDRTHPFLYLSYAAALAMIATATLVHLGEPPTWGGYFAFVVVALGLMGLRKRVTIRHHYGRKGNA